MKVDDTQSIEPASSASLPEYAPVRLCSTCGLDHPLESFRLKRRKNGIGRWRLERAQSCVDCEKAGKRAASEHGTGNVFHASIIGISPQQEAARRALRAKSGTCVCGRLAVEHPVAGCPEFFEAGL